MEINQIVEELSNMPVIKLIELTKALEDKWGVKAAQGCMPQMQLPTEKKEEEPEQTEFDVKLTSFGAKKVGIIKEVRQITGLALKEAKERTESLGMLKEAVTKEEADEIAEKIRSAGGEVEIK